MDLPTTPELFDLAGKAALVTGASGHLGAALAAGLAEAGARVVVASRELARAKQSAARLPSPRGGQHAAVEIDQMEESSIERGFNDAVAQTGGIDILVNNGHEPLADDWTKVDAAAFNRQLANATGYFLLARRLRDHAVERQAAASIVMLGSMYGLVGSYPEVYDDVSAASPVAYHALKGGIVQMTRHLAVYWAKDNVRVNCLSPGAFPSPRAPAELVERLKPRIPLGRIGAPHELRAAVVFLAADASSYMTGQNLVIDGGWTAW